MARPAELAAVPDTPQRSTEATAAVPETPHEVQAVGEGVPTGDTITFFGEQYRIADKIGLPPLISFARAARSGATASDMDGLAAIGDMLEDCIHPDDWDRFWAAARVHKADGDDLLPVVTQTIGLLSARPTQRPSDSSDGPPTTSENSTGSSSSPDTEDGAEIVSVADLLQRSRN